VSTGGFSVLPYLQYLFTSPILFFSRRRRTVYGTVYHAMTKVPLELVTVRLLRAQDRRLVKSVVTNAQGQYGLPVRDPGEYLLEYQKPGFSFPSQYLQGVQQDGIFADVLTSAQLRVTDRDVFVAPNVPMDPVEVSEAISLRNVRGARWRTRLQYVVAPLGAVAAGVSYVISPSSLGFGLFLAQCVVLGITARVAWPKKPAGWGVVLDKKTGKPVPNAVVRLFESRYNKLIDTVLTDSRGRYALLLGPNVYQTRFDKRGYATEHLAQLDLSARREPAALTERVKLTPTP
jgi:5-hydroxyisourate hydrolase-like protein (transthyretin family)